MGSSLSKEIAEICQIRQKFELHRLQELFKDNEDFDVFDIIYADEDDDEQDQYDCISLLLTDSTKIAHMKGSDERLPAIQFLEVIKKQLEKANSKKNATSKCQPQFSKMKQTYLERLVESRRSIEELSFFLDNSDIIPLVDPKNNEDFSVVLHALAKNKSSLPLLQDYLSSGKVENRFKNSDNDGGKMRHPTKYGKRTPIQVACANCNVEAVRELAVNNIGGANYTESIQTMLANADGHLILMQNEDAMVDICLCLLSQPNVDTIRNHIVQNETLKKVLCSEYPTERSKLLSIRLPENEKDEIQLATAAYILGMDKLHSCLLTNGCRYQKKKLECGGLQSSTTDKLRSILVDLRAQDVCVDINRGAPLVILAEKCAVDAVKFLLDNGSDVNQVDVRNNRRTALHACLTPRAGIYVAIKEDRIKMMEVLINAGAELNAADTRHETPLHCVLERFHKDKLMDDIISKFFELAKEKKEKLDTNFVFDEKLEGRTPLHQAIWLNSITAVKNLLPVSDLTVKTKYGQTPQEYALDRSVKPEIREIFVNLKSLITWK